MAKFINPVSLRSVPVAAPTAEESAFAADARYRAENSSFSQGLRSGATGMVGAANDYVGGAAEALGADEFAARRYAEGARASAQAAKEAPLTNSIGQVNGVRSGWDYVTGLAGQSIPYMLPALGAGAVTALSGGGALPVMGAMTAASLPVHGGEAIRNQQEDPIAMQRSAGERFGTANVAGAANAALDSAGPAMIGAKLLGRGAAQALRTVAKDGLGRTLAKEVPKNMLVEGGTEGAQEIVQQQAHRYMNPDRDTSHDRERLIESGAGGAILGGVFSGAGSVAQRVVAGKEMEAKAEVAPASPVPAKTFSEHVAGLGESLKPQHTTVEDGVQITADDTPESMSAKDEIWRVTNRDKLQALHAQLTADESATKFRPELQGADAATPEGQAQIRDVGDRHAEMQRVAAQVKAGLRAMDDAKPEAGTQQSRDYSGSESKIYKLMDTPEWGYFDEPTKKASATLVRRLIETGETGDVSPAAMRATVDLLGEGAVSRLSDIYSKMGSKDPAKVESFYKSLTKMSDVQKRDNKLLDVVRGALPDGQAETVRTSDIRKFVAQMQDFTREKMPRGMTPSQEKIYKGEVDDKFYELFGDKAESVSEAFAKHALGESGVKASDMEAKGSMTDEENAGTSPTESDGDMRDSAKMLEAKANELAQDGQGARLDANGDGMQLEGEYAPRYYGWGKDKNNQEMILNRRQPGSIADDELQKAKAQNADRGSVKFVNFDGLPPEMQMAHLNRLEATKQDFMLAGDDAKTAQGKANAKHGLPKDVGMVVAEGMKQEGHLTRDEFEGMRDDTRSGTSKNNPSRIDTGVKGAILDARKMVRALQTEHKTAFVESDNKSPQHRLARVFMEAVAAVQYHIGASFEVADSVVIDGKGTTWGDVKGLSMLPDHAGKEPSEFSQFLKEADVNELRKEAKPHQKIVDAYETAVSDRFEAMKKANVKITKEVAKAVYKELETPAIKDASTKLFRINSEVEGRADGTLVNKVDAPEQTMAQRRTVESDKQLSGYKAYVLEKTGVVATKKQIEDAKWAIAHGHTDGKRFGADLGTYFMQTEVNPYGQEHLARKAAGIHKEEAYTGNEDGPTQLTSAEEKLVIRKNLDGTSRAYATGTDPDVMKDAAAVDKRLATMARSPVAKVRELGAALRKLRGVYGQMTSVDKSRFDGVVLRVGKRSQMEAIIAPLVAKYADTAADPIKDTVRVTKLKPVGAKSEQNTDSADKSTSEQQAETKAAVERMLPGVRVAFKSLLHAGDYSRVPLGNTSHLLDMINLSVHALDPVSVGNHEALHGFIQHMRELDLHKVNDALYKLADSPVMRRKLEALLADHPGALQQIKSSGEERAAYMFQFWAAGKLDVNAGTKTVFRKMVDFIKKVFGVWSADERAVNILEYFQSGEFAETGMNDRNAVANALLNDGTNKAVEAAKKLLAPVNRIAANVLMGGSAVLKDMHNPAIDKISALIHSVTTGTNEDTGWISAQRAEATQVMNELVGKFRELKVTRGQIHQALEQLQSGVLAPSIEAQKLAHQDGPVRQMLDKMKAYMEEAGIEVKDMGAGKNYFPRVFDTSYISSHQKEFRAMLDKYSRAGKFEGGADALINKLMSNDGTAFTIETTRPGNQHLKERTLSFISAEDMAPFLQKDMIRTLHSYVTQSTRRAEWARRFGKVYTDKNGIVQYDESAVLRELKEGAVSKHGATPEQMRYLENFLSGTTGTLGDAISPKMRRIFGNMIVYQNVRLLPLAIFSMAVDPIGIMVKGGTVNDSFKAFKRGIKEMTRGFKKHPGRDEWYEISEAMGVIDSTALLHMLGSSYSQGMVGDTGRRINDGFFRYNLVEQFNTSMRVSATQAALGFIAKHADGTRSKNSTRWMSELNLQPKEVIVVNGRPLLTKQEFIDHGMDEASAENMSVKMRSAVNKWVDGAILRPNAVQKPGWMNDPHFALVAHLKQFMYSFNETILKRVTYEAKNGNYMPAMALASYVPMMIAADFIKGALLNGGDEPDYKKGWDLTDYVWGGMQRAGLFGYAQMGLDAAKDIQHGGTGIGGLSGPAIEQMIQGVGAMGGRTQYSSFAMNALPLNPIAKAAAGMDVHLGDGMKGGYDTAFVGGSVTSSDSGVTYSSSATYSLGAGRGLPQKSTAFVPAISAVPWGAPKVLVQAKPASEGGIKAVATYVIDGDTVYLGKGKERFECRLAKVDAPETSHSMWDKDQPFGQAAKKSLKDMVDGKEVTVQITTPKDKYNRAVCLIEVQGKNVNLELVKQGLAWVNERYVRDALFVQAQAKAKADRSGLWAQDNPQDPSKNRATKGFLGILKR